MMERLMRHELSRRAKGDATLQIRSAGTLARPGEEMHRHALTVLANQGLDGSDFRTTWLTEAAVADVDVVVGAAREHRAAAVRLRPALLNRAFTLAELARITAAIGPTTLPGSTVDERFLELVRRAAARRGETRPDDPTADDLRDPIGQPKRDFERCAQDVAERLSPIIDLLAPGGAPTTA